MFKILLLVAAMVITLSGFAFGQASNCPEVEVSGPSGVVDAGKKASFTLRVGNGEWDSKLSYVWTTSSGTISSGQGTQTIEVVPDKASITVTVDIKGLPEGCAVSVSESLTCGLGKPEAEKLDEFTGSLDKIAKERFVEIVDTAKADPNAQLYVFISGGAKNPAVSISRKRVVIVEQILKKLGDDTRMTFVHSDKHDDRVVIYLVPAGADIPTID